MTQDKFIEILIKKEGKEIEKRPEIFQGIVVYYDHEMSRYPDRIRFSFMDGKTVIYDIHTDQPSPVILENIQIIRRMETGYPKKRRRNR
ncbi:MAG: hypothetical protein J6U01_05985 [Clostridia bacterium]|nr:hypothetical protein [Clostridia bacterium]